MPGRKLIRLPPRMKELIYASIFNVKIIYSKNIFVLIVLTLTKNSIRLGLAVEEGFCKQAEAECHLQAKNKED